MLARSNAQLGLMFGFRPDRVAEILSCMDRLFATDGLREEWARRRATMLAAWSDPTDVYWEELRRFLPSAEIVRPSCAF